MIYKLDYRKLYLSIIYSKYLALCKGFLLEDSLLFLDKIQRK